MPVDECGGEPASSELEPLTLCDAAAAGSSRPHYDNTVGKQVGVS